MDPGIPPCDSSSGYDLKLALEQDPSALPMVEFPLLFCFPTAMFGLPWECRQPHQRTIGKTMSVFKMQDTMQLFYRLERTTSLIVRHPDFPGKAEAIWRCREDIEERFHQGM